MNLLEIKSAQDKVAKEFIDSIPYDAWRFFGRKEEVKVDGQFIALTKDGDMWQIGDKEFENCLEFWVKQLNGNITWNR